MGILHRQGLEHHGIGQREYRCVGTDTQCQSEYADQRKSRRLPQTAKAVTQIFDQCTHGGRVLPSNLN